jgi:hypothetical protein
MSTPREGSSSVPIPGGVWVTGGYDSESIFLNKTRKVGTPLPAARVGHCMVNYGDKIFSTGGVNENDHATSNVWQFDAGDNFSMADGPEMKNPRYLHGCGIVHSIHHGSRPLLVVAGSGSKFGATGTKTSEYWDFTVPGSTWELCSKSCSFFSYLYIIILKTIVKSLNMKSCIYWASKTLNIMISSYSFCFHKFQFQFCFLFLLFTQSNIYFY